MRIKLHIKTQEYTEIIEFPKALTPEELREIVMKRATEVVFVEYEVLDAKAGGDRRPSE